MDETVIQPSEKGIAPAMEVDDTLRSYPPCSHSVDPDGESDETDSDDLSM